MISHHLKSKLQENKEVSLGSWVTLGNSGIAEIMCQAKFDWICVDLEHSIISIDQAGEMIKTIDLAGKSPLVRLSSNDPVQIKRVMDHGSHGIIVPMVNSREDIEKASQAVFYPPKGDRGVGLARAQGYGLEFNSYKNQLNDSACIVVQIEHIKALDNLEDIFSHPDVDAFIIGPYDLTASMGISGEFNHPYYLDAYQKILEVAKKYNKCGGIHIVEPDTVKLKEVMDDGFNFIAYSVDIRMIDFLCQKMSREVEI